MKKDAILEALESKNYEAEFEPVSCIYEYTKYDCSKYYIIEGLDDASSSDMGPFTVNVQGDDEVHEFIYDMSCGDWEGDELCDDADIIDALESIDEFIPYDDYNGDKQWEVYANANHIPLDTPYYFREDEDYPKDIEELGDEAVDVPLRYFISKSHGTSDEFIDMECTISDQDLYDLYQLVKEEVKATKEEEKTIELPDCEIQKADPELYEAIKQEVEEEAENEGYREDEEQVNFIVCLSKELFDDNL